MASPAGIDLTGTVRSLLNIEVNTIISKDRSMSADPMPPLPHAMLDVADWYADFLCRAGVDLQPFLTQDVGRLAAQPAVWTDARSFSSGDLLFGADTFERLRWAAKNAGDGLAARSPSAEPLDDVLLYRILKNCDAIKGMFSRFGPDIMAQFGGKDRAALSNLTINRQTYFIPPDDLVTLQKIWDLGTDEVVAQTVVFLNGNVTTRIQNPAAQTLFGIHRQSVDVSIGCWHYLLQAIQEIAGAAIGTLLRPRA